MRGTYHSVSSDENCLFCRETMENTDALVHSGGEGDKHPIHTQCIRDWIAFSNATKCQVCQMETDGNTLVTWKEKGVVELKHLKNDLRTGALVGGTAGITFFGGIVVRNRLEPLTLSSKVLLFGGTTLVQAGLFLLVDGILLNKECELGKKISEAGAALLGRVKTATAGEIALGITGGVFLLIGASQIIYATPFLRNCTNFGALSGTFGVMGAIAGSVLKTSVKFFGRRLGLI